MLLITGITLFQIVYIITITPDKKNGLHMPQVPLAMYQKGAYYSGIKIFNGLPEAINTLNAKLNPICHSLALLGAHPILHVSGIRVTDISSKPKNFKIALKHHLLTHSFYSLDEFFSKQ